MLNKVFAVLAFVYFTILPTTLASPAIDEAYSVFHYDLSGLTGDWYAEAASPAIYGAFEKWFKKSGYLCNCAHTNFQAVGDYRLNATMTCNLRKKNNVLIGQATVTGHFDLFSYSTGLYSFWYKNEEAYYTTKNTPHARHTIAGAYDYYKNGVYYYPIPPNENSTFFDSYIEFTNHEDKMYSSLYTHKYLDGHALNKIIKDLGHYGINLIKLDTSSCH